ncbi:pullulanase [Paenibacillus piri]|uniref:Pullulanase n=2 Tax=Paenibacillus piri TaxID=2547395 RepID=A0A4R5KFX2_9BACL|nr:pullulanase [Paenibacillus piri]
MTITAYSVEQVKDPFAILPGERYEFKLDIEVPEDDELYSEQGLYVRVIYRVEEGRTGVVKYEIFERETEHYLDFDLEEEEEALIDGFCKEHLPGADAE